MTIALITALTHAVLLLGEGWGPALLLIPLALILVLGRGRFFVNMVRRVRKGEVDPKDDWDPFG